jgi:hypothetical protein
MILKRVIVAKGWDDQDIAGGLIEPILNELLLKRDLYYGKIDVDDGFDEMNRDLSSAKPVCFYGRIDFMSVWGTAFAFEEKKRKEPKKTCTVLRGKK